MVKGARQEKTGCVAMDHAMGARGMLSVQPLNSNYKKILKLKEHVKKK